MSKVSQKVVEAGLKSRWSSSTGEVITLRKGDLLWRESERGRGGKGEVERGRRERDRETEIESDYQ